MTMIGSTALVTGASGGIGAAIANRLAGEGARLVLVGRSQDALDALASTIHARHGERPTVIVLDLERRGCGALLLQQSRAAGIEVDLLLNNPGFGTYGPFETLAPEVEQAQIAVNIGAVVDLTHAFLPGMLRDNSPAARNAALSAASQKAYRLLYGVVEECQRVAAAPAAEPGPLVYAAWSLVHGLATLWVDGALPTARVDPARLAPEVTGLLGRMLVALVRDEGARC